MNLILRLLAVLLHLTEEQRERHPFGRWQNAVLGGRYDWPTSPRAAFWGDGVGVGLLVGGLYVAGLWWPVAWALATGFVAVDAAAHVIGTVWAIERKRRLPTWFRGLVGIRRAALRSPGVLTSIAFYVPIVIVDFHRLVEHPVGWLGGVPIVGSWIGLFIIARKGRS